MTDSNRQPGRGRHRGTAGPGIDPQTAQTDEQSAWKTITTPEDHEDFPGQMLVTRDPRTIMAWAQQRDAVPRVVPGPRSADRLDELRLDVRGASREGEQVSWDDWLSTFMTADLRFVYQERTEDGELSTYYRLDTTARQEGEARPS